MGLTGFVIWTVIIFLHYVLRHVRWKSHELPSSTSFDSATLSQKILLSKHELYLRKLCFYLPPGKFERGPGSFSFVSSFHGRPLIVEYGYAGTYSRAPQLELKFPVTQKLWLRITPQLAIADEKDEITLGIPELDARFRIWSDQPESAISYLTAKRVLTALSLLPGFNRLEVHRGLFKLLLIHPKDSSVKRSLLEQYLELMIQLIQIYESQTLPLRINLELSGNTLCPYCREKFQQTDEKHQCPGCRAALHTACWSENGRCTTWGCEAH